MAAALTMAMPTGAWASVGDDVRAQCAATAWDSATCGRLARIVDALVASEEVSDALAQEVEALPVDQRQWLVDVLSDLSNPSRDEIVVTATRRDQSLNRMERPIDGEDEHANGEDFSTMTATDPNGQPREPPGDTLANAIRKARDFIRRTLG